MPARASTEPHPGLAAARATRAAGPGGVAERLRQAYLELLKLSLTDAATGRSVSVGRTQEGAVMSRELAGDEDLRIRSAGMDWPWSGLTMVGLRRLDDLQACVETVVADGVEGDLIEAGAWRGGASMLMRATLDTLDARDRTVVVADSFEGFPARDSSERGRDELGVFHFLSVPLDEVRGNFARLGLSEGVEFVPGFFADTVPALRGRSWAVLRLDGDTYEATRLLLEQLYPSLSVGGYLIVDDYGAVPECRRAVDEFRAQHDITEPLEEIDWTGVRWRRERVPAAAEPTPAATPPVPATEPAQRGPSAPVPTIRELGLRNEVEALRARLLAMETEVARLRSAGTGRRWRRR